jgi:hypothetical protein
MCSQPISATEDAPGQITITYDTNIKIGGAVGFAVSLHPTLHYILPILKKNYRSNNLTELGSQSPSPPPPPTP